jgi:transcriptional regulator of nitric oxide reductase
LLFCGSEPAREGGLTADLFFADVRNPTVGVSLLAMRS